VKEIPGFKEIKVAKHGRLWYIVDLISWRDFRKDNPKADWGPNTIGGYHLTYGAACHYAHVHYWGQFN